MKGKISFNICLAICVLVLVLAGQAAADTHYVSLGQSIQTAIDDANDYDEIEVAPGTYYEAINFNGKAVRLYSYGGPSVTTIDANGITGAYHVVQCISGEGARTILEGFTITGGDANGPDPNDKYGGGMYNDLSSSPTITNCTFSRNLATYDGGGMGNENNSNPIVTNCTFSGNTASYGGGGMGNVSSSPSVTDCNFTGNSADYGGGMYNFSDSSPTVSNCTFSGNSAGEFDGGGMYNEQSNPTITNCTFSGNTGSMAGGMCNVSSSPTVTNCTFTNNSPGGGMGNYNSSPTVTNCTFSGNDGGMYNQAGYPRVTNCILWGDSSYEINDYLGSSTVNYSDVQGGYSGTGNIDADPFFVDANNPDPNLVNLRLLPDSLCIDKGSNSAPNLPPTDLAGNRRLFDGDGNGSAIVDMGAYEFGSLNLLAHWKLDESSGGIAHDSSGDNHGTLEPAPTLTPPLWLPAGGRFNGALQLDGVDDYVDCGNDDRLNITDEITLGVWVNTNDAGNGQCNPYISKGDHSYAIKHHGSNNIEFFIYDSDWHVVRYPVDSSFNGAWHHLAGTYDGMMLKLYVDGYELANSPYAGSIAGSAFNVNIGRNAEITDRFYDGLIDGVAIFSRALEETEITDLKNNGGESFLADPNLKALWELDESSGTTAYDNAGGNHGTLEPDPPVWQPAGGLLDGALEFDGSNDCVFIPNESRFDITYQVTVSAWIKVNAFERDWQAIVTKGDSAWRLHRLRDTNSIAFNCNLYPDSWGAEGSINVNNGQWHHVAGVYDGTRAYLYVDGVLDSSEAAFGLIGTNDYPVMIGENAEQTGRYWNGLIDDVRIYTCALSPSEVYQLYSKICYVDADANGLNDGTSWENAYNYLQDALAAQATSGWEIRVAQGTYKPDATSSNPSGTGDRTATFQLINGVTLKGGYAGFGQPDPNARDCDLYETTLSGDINTPGDDTDNCYHVVTSSECDLTTVLEGFTITGGNANGTEPNDRGAGMYNNNSSPAVTNCTLSGNIADYGGGMGNENNSNPIVTNCTFSGNIAAHGGGGMGNENNGNPIVTNCTFSGNTASYGGGMGNAFSNPTVTDCNFSNNSATFDGGGMYNDQSSPTVTDCTFDNNKATTGGGGGMYNYYSSPSVTNCTFSGNEANGNTTDMGGGGMHNNSSSPAVTNCKFSGNMASHGGGMFNQENSNPTVTDCTFSGNWAATNGGGMYNNGSSPTVTNCNFNRNSADYGGGMYNYSNSSPTLTDCTFSGNSAYDAGGGMYNYDYSSPTVTNCTFNSNSASEGSGMFNRNNCSPTVTNCTFSSNLASGGIGGGMYNLNWSSPAVTNCTFSGNWAATNGGGMDSRVGSNPTVTNCTFSQNTADTSGGGMFNYQSSPTVTNCILWNDAPDEIFNNSSSPTVTYSDVKGGIAGTGGNIKADPLFVQNPDWGPDGRWGTADDDYGDLHLLEGSPCIDKGSNAGVPAEITNDLDGYQRIIDGDCNDAEVVDMGAYEFNYAYMGDLDYNCGVDFFDFSILSLAWRTRPPDAQWNHLYDISNPADNFINWRDLAILGDNWLAQVP